MLEGPILKSFTINGPINSQEKKNEAFTANVPLSNKNKWTWRKKKVDITN